MKVQLKDDHEISKMKTKINRRFKKKSGGSNKSYTCSVCHKIFSSPQAVGGHQNAHRRPIDYEMLKKFPIGAYRKRRQPQGENAASNVHASPFLLKTIPKHLLLPIHDRFLAHKSSTVTSIDNRVTTSTDGINLMNFFPPKELSFSDELGMIHAQEDAKGKECNIIGFDASAAEIASDKLDLTLKL